jgi:hypothetical protein
MLRAGREANMYVNYMYTILYSSGVVEFGMFKLEFGTLYYVFQRDMQRNSIVLIFALSA